MNLALCRLEKASSKRQGSLTVLNAHSAAICSVLQQWYVNSSRLFMGVRTLRLHVLLRPLVTFRETQIRKL